MRWPQQQSICSATTTRHEAMAAQAQNCSATLLFDEDHPLYEAFYERILKRLLQRLCRARVPSSIFDPFVSSS